VKVPFPLSLRQILLFVQIYLSINAQINNLLSLLALRIRENSLLFVPTQSGGMEITMKGSSKINHRPYRPINRFKEVNMPYICRLAPYETYVEIEWFNNGSNEEHTLFYGVRENDKKTAITVNVGTVKIENLLKDTDYEFYIEAPNGDRSETRFFRTGEIPNGCSVINYLHPEDPYYDYSGKFLGTPAIIRTKSGKLIASMDVFESWKPQNVTLMFYSEDDGKNWKYITDLYPFYWTTLFYYKEKLYALGLTTEYGSLQIICSEDEGETWTEAKTLFHGSNCTCKYGGVHKPPMQIVSHNGRLYMSCEYGCWEYGSHLPAVISIDENDDLMVAENWSMTEVLPYDGEWAEKSGKQGDTIEGNLVVAPDGNMYNFMRYKIGEMLKLKVNTEDPDAMLEFSGIINAPVSNSMFRIVPVDDKYIMITNRKTEEAAKYEHWSYRNVLSMYETTDLENFTLVKDIFNFEHIHPKEVGFQYPAVLYENGEIRLMVRSAFNKADNSHNSNYMLFCKL